MRRLLIAAFLSGLAFQAMALPTVEEVQAEAAKGHYAEAETMMQEVVAARPGSARAHYVYAEMLAHDRRFDLAAEQVAQARSIDPALKFTDPDRFRAFEQLLAREQASARGAGVGTRTPALAPPTTEVAPVQRSAGIPGWVWVLGLAGLGFVAWRALSARRPAAAGAAPYAPAVAGGGAPAGGTLGGGYGPGYPPAPGAGSGLLGTGMAVAGGVAAGMLAEKLLEGHRGDGLGLAGGNAGGGSLASDLMGGGRSDDSAARELEQRPIDFGSGDEWGGGDAPASDDGW